MIYEPSLIQKIGAAGVERLRAVKVGIAGAGGLGSNCAQNLVRCGFLRLKLVDFDIVEASNLDRQFYFTDQTGMAKVDALKINLLRINSGLDVEALTVKIGEGDGTNIFGDCDIVAECLDRAEAKSRLVSELLPMGKLIVAASGLGGYGETDRIRVRRIRNNLVIVGDLTSDITDHPALSPRVSITAAKQVDVILEYVLTSL
ncbi:MAG: thiamine biosynthesis protein ThiF [Deltaproteobacteria bacterium HGW-Deltaproteobacteria-7]|jgi:sulfur carrier protein ThiS adenylyltransferase|nr:MAG: thiamine biosynthesis protein ThiF [Deltaproteobacteria bacterium HGW-Deltaproteobacteria-7]PKN18502.1 MAG: thiamine biosynthesis protein ThiF [Deltaproteobacteria bacterium HGW-Deltaproteobacteria-6]